jgi:hypothetical protein
LSRARERVLSARELNRALLARQLLLTRSSLPLIGALEQLGGLQAQYAPSAYVGLWSRLAHFRLADLTRALQQRRAVQATLMRSTIHIVSARDYWPFAEGVRRARGEWWQRTHGKHLRNVDMTGAAAAVRKALAAGAHRRDELVAICRAFAPAGRGTEVWQGLPLQLVRIPPSGTWDRRRADLYATADDWLGPATSDEGAGLEVLLRRYLAGFGPGRLSDAARWAGVDTAMLQEPAERLGLRRFRDDEGKVLLDLPRRPLPGVQVAAPVRFMPTFDATLFSYVRRTELLPERFRPVVFDVKNPQSLPTFLVDGSVAGAWRVDRAGSKATLMLRPFERLPVAATRELREEAGRLARFVEPTALSYAVRAEGSR